MCERSSLMVLRAWTLFIPSGCILRHKLDNNNCAPSFLRSLCEIGGDCFGPRYFSEGAQLPKKNTEVQNNHRRIKFTQWPKQRWCKVIIVINNRYFDNFVCFMCIFLQKHEENSIFYHFCTHPCKRISISPDVVTIARCDKCANTGCIARDCLFVYAYARKALALIPTSHAEVIITSHNDCAVFRAKLVIIYVDWIALLRRLLTIVHALNTINELLINWIGVW